MLFSVKWKSINTVANDLDPYPQNSAALSREPQLASVQRVRLWSAQLHTGYISHPFHDTQGSSRKMSLSEPELGESFEGTVQYSRAVAHMNPQQ